MSDIVRRPETVIISGTTYELDLPVQFHELPKSQQDRQLKSALDRLKKRLRWEQIVTARAKTEVFQPPEGIEFRRGEGPPSPTPRYIIRAVYGPLCGIDRSRILVLKYDAKYLQRRVIGGIDGLDEVHASEMQYDTASRSWRPPEDSQGKTDFVETRADSYGPHSWGPRAFLWNLLEIAAYYGGDCLILMVHSGSEIRLDVTEFEAWVSAAKANPVGLLTEARGMLADTKRDPA